MLLNKLRFVFSNKKTLFLKKISSYSAYCVLENKTSGFTVDHTETDLS